MSGKRVGRSRSLLRIGEAAELLGVSAGTLRNWDKAGKLTPLRHPVNGYRLYRREELEKLLREISGESAGVG